MVYFPAEIVEFGVENEIYESGIVDMEMSPVSLSNLSNEADLKIERDTAFLKVLIRGRKGLYYLKNSAGKINFYISHDTGYALLIYKKYYNLKDGVRIVAENKQYTGQLHVYLIDCPDIMAKMHNVTYSSGSLTRLFKHYYSCTNSQTDHEQKTDKIKVEFGLIAGAALNTITFKSNQYDYLTKGDINPSISFAGGIFLDLVLPRNQRKWSIYNEQLLTSSYFNGKYTDYTNENKYTLYTIHIGYTYMTFNNLIRFKYPFGKYYWYVNGGISNRFAIIGRNDLHTELKLYAVERTYDEYAISFVRTHEFGFIIGTGVKYKDFCLDARYVRGNGMSDGTQLGSVTNQFIVMIGYRF
jgi:hypothetical protein